MSPLTLTANTNGLRLTLDVFEISGKQTHALLDGIAAVLNAVESTPQSTDTPDPSEERP